MQSRDRLSYVPGLSLPLLILRRVPFWSWAIFDVTETVQGAAVCTSGLCAGGGEILACRAVTLSQEFTARLFRAIGHQAARPFKPSA
jgi:hypothetical protein